MSTKIAGCSPGYFCVKGADRRVGAHRPVARPGIGRPEPYSDGSGRMDLGRGMQTEMIAPFQQILSPVCIPPTFSDTVHQSFTTYHYAPTTGTICATFIGQIPVHAHIDKQLYEIQARFLRTA